MRTRLLAYVLGILVAAATSALAGEDSGISGRFMLDTQDGRRITDEAFAGKVRVVTFGYTFCPDICPTTLSTLSVVVDRMRPQADKVAFLFVSVDPERDTSSHLKDYLASFPGITGLTGTPGMVASAARNFKVVYEKHPAGPSGEYSIDHSAGIYIMGRNGEFLAKLPHITPPDEVAQRVDAAIRTGR
ncbi:MAG: SCO family protein [Actinomycetota bacterium]